MVIGVLYGKKRLVFTCLPLEKQRKQTDGSNEVPLSRVWRLHGSTPVLSELCRNLPKSCETVPGYRKLRIYIHHTLARLLAIARGPTSDLKRRWVPLPETSRKTCEGHQSELHPALSEAGLSTGQS